MQYHLRHVWDRSTLNIREVDRGAEVIVGQVGPRRHDHRWLPRRDPRRCTTEWETIEDRTNVFRDADSAQ